MKQIFYWHERNKTIDKVKEFILCSSGLVFKAFLKSCGLIFEILIGITILLLFVFPGMFTAQKKILGHQDNDRWNTLESIQISGDGQVAVWVENPEYYQGKPFTHLDRYR